MASYTLRSGAQLVTATPDVGDAAALLAYVNRVAAESDFLTFGPGEHGITLAEEVAFLEAGASTWRFLRKATIEGEIVGFLDLRRSPDLAFSTPVSSGSASARTAGVRAWAASCCRSSWTGR